MKSKVTALLLLIAVVATVMRAKDYNEKFDVNRDGKVSVADVTALVNYILGKTSGDAGQYDVNQDGKVSVADVTSLVNNILGKGADNDDKSKLTIHFADGTTRDILLSTQPRVTFEGDDVVITTLDASYSYDALDVLRFTYAGKPLDNSASSGDGSIGEAFYIYRNDGEFNAFFRDEVDSIAYSDYDIDSIRHTNFVVQDVFTEDSIYRIPLAAIDSVGFVTPTPILQANVRIMNSEWAPYIKSVEDNMIVFSKNIPVSLMPSVGEILVTEFPNTDFAEPFSGRIANIKVTDTGIECLSTDVCCTDIYRRLVFIGRTITESNQSMKKGAHKKSSKIEPIKIDRNKLRKKITVEQIEGMTLTLEWDPQIELQYYMLIDDDAKSIYRIRTLSETSVQIGFETALMQKTDSEPRKPWTSRRTEIDKVLKNLKIPFEFPIFTGLTAFIETRPVLDINADFSVGITWSFTSSRIDDVYKDSNDRIRHISVKNEFTSEPPTCQASISGEVFGGVGIRIGIGGVSRNFLSCGLDIKLGLLLKGNASFSVSPFDIFETTAYETFKDTRISFGGRVEIIPFFTILNFFDSEESYNVLKFRVLPLFELAG